MAPPETREVQAGAMAEKNTIPVRIMKHWSSLPRELVGSLSLDLFKS